MSAMRKRGRENPCEVCHHFHDMAESCAQCGHRVVADFAGDLVEIGSAYPSEILDEFIYLGSYDDASRHGILHILGIYRILNTVPACNNMCSSRFLCHRLKDEDFNSQVADAAQFLDQCEREKARVLVFCMSGRNRSPAIIIAYLMKHKRWGLAQSIQWVKNRRSLVELSQDMQQQLLQYEHQILSLNEPMLVQNNPLLEA